MLINLKQKRLDVAFGCASLCLLLLPSINVLFFSPCLVIYFYQRTFLSSLWAACICGLIIDTFSCSPQFGIYALNYCLCTAFLYSKKQHFFPDSFSTLPLMTYLFSLLFTIIDGIFHIYSLSWQWLLTDVCFMPFIDSFYALILFLLPSVRFKEEYSLKS